MKSTNTLLWAILATTTGITAAQAATETFTVYSLGLTFTNTAAQYWTVSDGPKSSTANVFPQIAPMGTSLQTDGHGKITGTGFLELTYNASGVPFSLFEVTYKGQISAPAGESPTVNLTMQGNGFTSDASGGTNSTVNSILLKFAGQPGVNPLTPNQTRLVGNLSGTVRGMTPLGNTSSQLFTVPGVITSSKTNFLRFTVDVAQDSRKMSLFASGAIGTGSVQVNNYKFSLLGTGASSGEVLLVNGILGKYVDTIGTNSVAVTAPASPVNLSGKINGQVVSGTAATITVQQVSH